MEVVSQSVAAAQAQLTRMRQLDHEQSIPASMFVPSFRSSAETVIVVAAGPVTSPAAAPAPGTPSPASAAVATSKPAVVEEDDLPLTETVRAELRRLENTVRDMSEVNDRVMAQNIALLADLEAAQRAVRELRAEKDTLEVQLRKALERNG
jgi:hypothetical protein